MDAVKVKASYRSLYGQSWALVIGINKYKFASPLGFAVNDARAIAEVLRSRFGFRDENVKVLIDEEATREAIRDAFLDLTGGGQLEEDDRLLVFFAGHRHTITGMRGEIGFLVPFDGKPSPG